jgi:hypothetical protein
MSVNQLSWLWLPCMVVVAGCTSSNTGGTAGKGGGGWRSCSEFHACLERVP